MKSSIAYAIHQKGNILMNLCIVFYDFKKVSDVNYFDSLEQIITEAIAKSLSCERDNEI